MDVNTKHVFSDSILYSTYFNQPIDKLNVAVSSFLYINVSLANKLI